MQHHLRRQLADDSSSVAHNIFKATLFSRIELLEHKQTGKSLLLRIFILPVITRLSHKRYTCTLQRSAIPLSCHYHQQTIHRTSRTCWCVASASDWSACVRILDISFHPVGSCAPFDISTYTIINDQPITICMRKLKERISSDDGAW